MILLCQALLLLGLAAQILVPNRGAAFLTCFGLQLIASAAWLYLALAVVRGTYRPNLPEALGITLALHLLALFLAPALSDDIYRYLFEGRLVLDGINPYLTAPASEAALPYSQSLWGFDRINNPEISAAYPPAVQYALALGVLISSEPLGMKLVFGAFSIGAFVLLWFWLPDLGVNRRRAILYGYCPLMALEFAGEGHSDSLAVFCLLAACMASGRHRGLAAGALLAMACAGKLLPVLFLPFLARRSRASLLSFAITIAVLYLPFIPWADPMSIFSGTMEYSTRWRSNDSAFYLIYAASEYLHGLGLLGSMEVQKIAKFPLAAMGLGLLFLAYRRRLPVERAALAFFLFFVAFAPTLHPWYCAFLLPFLCLWPNPAWLGFFASVYLAYHVLPLWLSEGRWEESVWIKSLEYAPFYLGFLGSRGLLAREPEGTRTTAVES